MRTDWSGPAQYDFVVTQAPLVISEINYNPLPPSDAELAAIPGLTGEDFEFLEIQNPGPAIADLVGVELSDGVTFDFSFSGKNTLAPGEYALVVSNPAAFSLRYKGDRPVAGQYVGNLNNTGEDVDLIDGTGSVLFTVFYGDNDPWPVRADGAGSTLELIAASGTAAAAQSKHYSWRASTQLGGSPGLAAQEPPGVVINEVLANSAGDLSDAIELYNTSAVPVDMGGWYLSDSSNNYFKYQIPAGTVLAPHQYLVLDESHFNSDNQGDNGFGLSGDEGDEVWLTVRDGEGQVRWLVDSVQFGGTAQDQSLARLPNGTGRLAPAKDRTFGGENGGPFVGPLVISELNYNPGSPSQEALTADKTVQDTDLEFIEIHNPTTAAIDLTNWRIRGGVDFDFDAGTSLAAGESLIVVPFNPANPENVKRLNAFRAATKRVSRCACWAAMPVS